MTEAWPHRRRAAEPGAILAAAAALAEPMAATARPRAPWPWRSARAGTAAAPRQELQLAVMTAAGRIFDEEVVQPALAAPAGLAQLAAVCEAFFGHLERHACPGGSFLASAALEMGTRAGPVRDLITAMQAQFGELIRGFAAAAVARHELPAVEDPAGWPSS